MHLSRLLIASGASGSQPRSDYCWRGKLAVIRADNGPELVSGRLMEWAAKHQIHIAHVPTTKCISEAI